MASKKTFKPPAKKTDFPRKHTVSLTDEQYDELFNAVLHSSQKAVDVKSPTMADIPRNTAKSPKECASVENSQSSQPEKQQLPKPGKNTDTSTLSTINTEEFLRDATFSTPVIIQKPNTYREALKNLKNMKMESFSETGSLNSSVVELIDDEPLSQPPPHLTRRERLQWLQDRRGTGLYVKCDNPKCGKWRWLDIADPVDIPHEWFCRMNPDKAYASCSIPEKIIPMCVEDDLIHNCYTAGSIVWAKMVGYPWWPAMVDDCPDCEQYYWINNELYDVPNWYHVVFFDANEVTRQWMLVKDLKSFKHSPNFDEKFKIKLSYKKRLAVAKQKANAALKLHVKDRLKEYSFLSRWQEDIPEFNDSDLEDSDLDENNPNYGKVIKKKVNQRRKALILSQESSSSKKSHNTDTKIKNTSKKAKRADKKSKEQTVSKNFIYDIQNSPKLSSNRVQTRRMSQNSDTETKSITKNAKIADKKSKEETVSKNLIHDIQKSPKLSFNGVQTRRMSQNSDIETKSITKKGKIADKKSKGETDLNTLSQESNETSISFSPEIQTCRMNQNSDTETQINTETPKKANKKSKEETASITSSQESDVTSISSFEGVQTRRMSQNSRRNSETEGNIETEKSKKIGNKSTTKKKLGKNTKVKKENKKIVARRNTLALTENLNKTVPIIESKKIDLTRRKSEYILKERDEKNARNLNKVKVDKEFVKQLTNRCNNLLTKGKTEPKKLEKIFEEDKKEFLHSSKKIGNTPNKKRFDTSELLNNSEASSAKGKKSPKRRKLNDEIIPSTKTNTIIKKKKSFMPPVKKSASLDTSSSNVSSSNFQSPLFEEIE